MRKHKTAYELAKSQVETPPDVVRLFWQLTHNYRSHFSSVLDLGAGDGRFAVGGRFASYEGVEIDTGKRPFDEFPKNAAIQYMCAFKHRGTGYAACIGNPPYVRHHDLDEIWRDALAARLKNETGEQMNRKCNLYVYFLLLALLKSRQDGLVSALVPYEWVSRPSAVPLRGFIRKHRWHVDIYRFSQPIFPDVLTTASISVIDKRNRDGEWILHQIDDDGATSELSQKTGSHRRILPYQERGKLWAMRGMSPGTQKVFTLTEGERVHAGLRHEDVFPCVTSFRDVPLALTRLTAAAFRKRFVDAGAKCWLIRSHDLPGKRLQAYLDSILECLRDTATCHQRDPWFKYDLHPHPRLLISSGFTSYGPKALTNDVGAYAVGSVCGVHVDGRNVRIRHLRNFLANINFEHRVVAHSGNLKKIEIRQLNAVLNRYTARYCRD